MLTFIKRYLGTFFGLNELFDYISAAFNRVVENSIHFLVNFGTLENGELLKVLCLVIQFQFKIMFALHHVVLTRLEVKT